MDTLRNVSPLTTESDLRNDRPQRQRVLTALKSIAVSSIYDEAVRAYKSADLTRDWVDEGRVVYRAASVPLNKVLKGMYLHFNHHRKSNVFNMFQIPLIDNK